MQKETHSAARKFFDGAVNHFKTAAHSEQINNAHAPIGGRGADGWDSELDKAFKIVHDKQQLIIVVTLEKKVDRDNQTHKSGKKRATVYADTKTPFEKIARNSSLEIKVTSRLCTENVDPERDTFKIRTLTRSNKGPFSDEVIGELMSSEFRRFTPNNHGNRIEYQVKATPLSSAIRDFLTLSTQIGKAKMKIKTGKPAPSRRKGEIDGKLKHSRGDQPTLNQIFYGPPGTGKTYQTPSRCVEIIEGAASDTPEKMRERYSELVRLSRISFITFHQSYSYEDFVEGIRPVLTKGCGGESTPRYECRDGLFKQIAVRALYDCLEADGGDTEIDAACDYATMSNVVQGFLRQGAAGGIRLKEASEWNRFVLVIDEINRGNISKIFGELITLVEEDKRVGKSNELVVTLPYSGEFFAIPSNLHMIGTMNSADKSIALVDIALRRRFEFQELRPDFSLCPDLTEQMQNCLNELNRRIELRKDRDHRIGHAYFIKVKEEDELNETFLRKIIPLLQEYFYNDWESLRFVLGENGDSGSFIKKLEGSDERGARTKWQWYLDAAEQLEGGCLGALATNYGISAE